jgi:hypothetical protein
MSSPLGIESRESLIDRSAGSRGELPGCPVQVCVLFFRGGDRRSKVLCWGGQAGST